MTAKKNLADWLCWIEQQHSSAIDLGLQRITGVFYDLLGLSVLAKRIVIVAGTNGKGSTIAALEALLLGAKLKVASYTSPHILKFNERICINGQPVDDESLCAAFAQIQAAQKGVSLSFFEYTTLAAMLIFAKHELDVLLLEVGLGGRLDAVNVLNADIAVITSIALDHQQWLGHTLEAIAFEKAGILRRGAIFVCGQTPVKSYLQQLASAKDCSSYFWGSEFELKQTEEQQLYWQGTKNYLEKTANYKLPALQLPLNSVACALQVLQLLGVTMSAARISYVLQRAKLSGRFQKLNVPQHHVVVDVAHNPAAVALLKQQLIAERVIQKINGKVLAVFSALQDKDIASMIDAIADSIDVWYIAEIQHERAETGSNILALLIERKARVCSFSTLQEAFAQAYATLQQQDLLLAFGSFHVVAEILQYTQTTDFMISKEPQ